MQSYRWKCGKAILSTTDVLHDWKPQFNRNTGKPDRPHCRRCYTSGPKPEETE